MSFVELQKNRESKKTLVFFPGWGFDGRVARYGVWPDDVTLLVPDQFTNSSLVGELYIYLDRVEINQVALLGWSMGAHLAWDFVRRYPECVSRLTILAGRSRWPAHEIAEIKKDLGAGCRKYMQGFYRKCFLGRKDLYQKFAAELEGDYLARLQEKDLVEDLDYLVDQPIYGPAPAGVSVHILHGGKDVVAPVVERPQIEGARQEVIDTAGHLIFGQPNSYRL